MNHTSKDNSFLKADFATLGNLFIKFNFRQMIYFIFVPNLKPIWIFLTWWSQLRLASQTQIKKIFVHNGWSIGRHRAVQVNEHCNNNIEHFCPFFHPRYHAIWNQNSACEPLNPFSQVPVPTDFRYLVKSWCLLAKNLILHHINQLCSCDYWNIKVKSSSHCQCLLVGSNQYILSL